MIDLDCVASFLAVASSGSFREAAQCVGLSQPAVTQHVKKLERSLNAILIDRGTAGSVLTPEGRAFVPYAESLLRTSDRAHALFKRNSLVVGASSNVGIYLLPAFLKAGGETLGVEFDVVIGDNPGIAAQITDLVIDVAVMEWWNDRPGFVAERWKREPLVVIVPPGHPWSERKSIEPHMLSEVPLLGGEAGTGTGRLLRQSLGAQADSIKSGLQLGSTEAVKRAVRAGLGISIVMRAAVAEEHREGSLCAIPIEDAIVQKDIWLVRRDTGAHVGLAARFVRFLQEHADCSLTTADDMS